MRRTSTIFLFFILVTSLSTVTQADNYTLLPAEFHWLEIEDFGEHADGLRTNGFSGPFEIGFTFNYFGNDYEEFWIGSNGFIGFGPSFRYGWPENVEMPGFLPPDNIVALFWKAYDHDAFWAESAVYYGIRDGKLVIQYQDYAELNRVGIAPENTITMQLVLEPDGDIILQYSQVGEEFNLAVGTIGVEGPDGEEGNNIRFNGEGVEVAAGTAYRLTQNPPGNFLVWDAGGNTPSGVAQEDALQSLDYNVTRVRQLPRLDDLLQYEAVFANLGNIGVGGNNYHELTQQEGRVLSEYLDLGGSLYLEGSNTWTVDDATPVHAYFMIDGLGNGVALQPPVSGIEGSLAEGIVFEDYDAPGNLSVDRLAGVESAEPMFTFREGDETFVGMIAFESYTYRTIGCSFEFGGLVDGDNGTKFELMSRIVRHFRSPLPELLPPVNLRAYSGDQEVTLQWDWPPLNGQLRMRIVDLQHDIARLMIVDEDEKHTEGFKNRALALKRQLAEATEERPFQPRRDELHGFNVYLNGQLFDFTNAHRYTAIELDNGQDCSFEVTAVYEAPEGESDPAGPVIVIPSPMIVPPYTQDFEESRGPFSPRPIENGWEWGEPEMGAASGDNAWGTRLEAPYPDNADLFLYTPVINLVGINSAQLNLKHYLHCEGGFDGGRVEISIGDPDRWVPLVPVGGYPEVSVFALDGAPGFSGRTEGWENVTFELAAYLNQRIMLRFVFKSDDSFNFAGWFIDDIWFSGPDLGRITITVVEDDDERTPVADARVSLGPFSAISDGLGQVRFRLVPEGNYQLHVEKFGYVDFDSGMVMQGGDQLDVQIVLDRWNSLLAVDPDEISEEIDAGDSFEEVVRLINNGEDGTRFQVYIDFDRQGNQIRLDRHGGTVRDNDPPRRDEPWDLIRTYDISAETGEQFFISAHMVHNGTPSTYLLIAGAGDFNRDPRRCYFYKFFRDGEFVGEVAQDRDMDGWGVRDLAYDGIYLYGSIDERIFVINPTTGLVIEEETETPLNVNRAIAYDEESDAFWVGDADDIWVKVNREGIILDRVLDHGLERVTGMAWNPSDDAGANLYVHNQESEEGGGAVYRFNPETRELERVLETAAVDEGYAGGAFVTHLMDTQNYVLGVVIQGHNGNDVIKLYELWQRDSWLSVSPASGEIGPDNDMVDLTLTFDASNLIESDQFAIVEVHDLQTGVVNEIICELSVQGGAASIFGTVSADDAGELIGFTDIKLIHGERYFETNPIQDGEEYVYRFDNLFPGVYIIEAELEGYLLYRSDPLELELDENLEFPIEMLHKRFGGGGDDELPAISGHVTMSRDRGPFEGVEVSAVRQGDHYFASTEITDDQGNYNFNPFVNPLPEGDYLVTARFQNWRGEAVEGVEVREGEEVEVDFVLDDILPVESLTTNGNFDDHILLTWLEPGTIIEEIVLQHDDGVLANGVYLRSRQDILATRFDPEGRYDILSIMVYLVHRDELGGDWPDGTRDNTFVKIFNIDPGTGLPGRMLVNENLSPGQQRWRNLPIFDMRFLEGPFFIGWNQDPGDDDYEAVGLDEHYDWEGTTFIRMDNVWQPFDVLPGDLMIRAYLWSYLEDNVVEMVAGGVNALDGYNISHPLSVVDLPDNVVLLDPAYNLRKKVDDPTGFTDIHKRISFPRRDEPDGYRIYIDGELNNDQDLVDIPFFEHSVDNDEDFTENTLYHYMIAAVYAVDEEEVEIEGAEAEDEANSAPEPVDDIEVELDGFNYTITWSRPEENEDRSDCIDYAGCEIFLDGELLGFVAEDEGDVYAGVIEPEISRWYTFTLIARDEVPNRSQPTDITAAIGEVEIFDFERGGLLDADPRLGAWQRSQFLNRGPGDAHSGLRAWGTRPMDGDYGDNVDWKITTVTEFLVETEPARMDFFHFLEVEEGHDGGQVLVSVDGGEWRIIEPLGGYPDRAVAGLINTPGFSTDVSEWTIVSFDLEPYIDHRVRVRWRFGSDASVHRYSGWYIDDLAMWGCRVVNYAQVAGMVMDQDNMPVEDALVTDGRVNTTTDPVGAFVLTGILPGQASVRVSKPGYSSGLRQLDLEPGDSLGIEFELYHPFLGVESGERILELRPGDVEEFSFNLANVNEEIPVPFGIRITGSPGPFRDIGPVRRARSISEPNMPRRDDPWDVAFDYELVFPFNYGNVQGAEFADGQFFLTAGNRARGAWVVVLTPDGSLIRVFRQPFDQVGWGLRDLAWDGELLYASQDENICSFTPDGEAVEQFTGAPLTMNRALAYDPETDGFWAAEWDSPWYLVDREGEVQFLWEDHDLQGVYGLAYHPQDPDGMILYALNLEEDGSTAVYRADPRNDSIEQVHEVDGQPTGCFISGSWDADRWIMGGVFESSPPHLIGFELGNRIGWINADPIAGEIDPTDDVDVLVTIQIPDEAQQLDDYSAVMTVSAFGGVQAVISFEVNIDAEFQHFHRPAETNQFMTVHLESAAVFDRNLPPNSEIAVLTPRGDVGGIAHWYGDPVDFEIYQGEEAFQDGEPFDFRLWSVDEDIEYLVDEVELDGPDRFQAGREVSVGLSVEEINTQVVALAAGWNLISTFIRSADPLIEQVLNPLLERGSLRFAKDGRGRFWWPDADYNGLRGDWNVRSAYLVKVSRRDTISFGGYRVQSDMPIIIDQGWNHIGYLLGEPELLQIAIADILDYVILIKNGTGRFAAPRYDYFGLNVLVPGAGYMLKSSAQTTLTYRPAEEMNGAMPPPVVSTEPLSTGSDMSLLITSVQGIEHIEGAEVTVFAGAEDLIVGRSELSAVPCGVVVRGDDTLTADKDGAFEDEQLSIVLFDESGGVIPIKITEGPGELLYHSNGFTTIDIEVTGKPLPTEFYVSEVYPNPFNSIASLRFGLTDPDDVYLKVWDVRGRLVYELQQRSYRPGWHVMEMDASMWTSGIYFVELITSSNRTLRKMTLLR